MRREGQRRITKAYADEVAQSAKYIEGRLLRFARKVPFKKELNVNMKDGRNLNLKLDIRWKGGEKGVALRLNNLRIRGINLTQRHQNPDKRIVKGWHEHIYKPPDGDRWTYELRRNFQSIDELVQFALNRYNIDVLGGPKIQVSPYLVDLGRVRDEKK